jgi:glycosyltransferase involved in cell wall biosynthesis
METKLRIYFFFSNVIDSAIYRSLLLEFATEDYELHCIFIGNETLPLFRFSQTLPVKSQHVTRTNKTQIVQLMILFICELAISRPKVVFCFGQTASIVGLTASALSCKAKRHHLRMHTSMNRVERFPRGILYDKLSNFLAQVIVVPNKNTQNYLIDVESVKANKLVEISFGFHLIEFGSCDSLRIQAFKEFYDIPTERYVIGIASRFTHIKGLQYSLPAVSNFLANNPLAMVVLAGFGEEIPQELHDLLADISKSQLRLIPRVADMPAFYGNLSAFIHTPIDETVESFGLVYIEAFAAGVPAIITLSGIAKEVAIDGVNSMVVNYRDSAGIQKALETLVSNKDLSEAISLNAKKSVSTFGMEKMCANYVSLIKKSI